MAGPEGARHASNVFERVSRSPSLTDRVAEQLLDFILSDELQVGERLPSERSLGESFGVSRTVVREAVRSLAAKGVIDVQSGSGIRVAAVEAGAVTETLGLYLRGKHVDYEKVHEVRSLLEVEIAATAARRATPDDVMAIEEAHATMTRHLDDVSAATIADLAFHRTVASATHNELHGVLMDSIGSYLIAVRKANIAAGFGAAAIAQHEQILAAIRCADPAAAGAAMTSHLSFVAGNLQNEPM